MKQSIDHISLSTIIFQFCMTFRWQIYHFRRAQTNDTLHQHQKPSKVIGLNALK